MPPRASVTEARFEVRRSLESERDRVRERIEANLSSRRDAFLRRAVTNALLALVVGLLLWGLHHGAMGEMEKAIPFLEWVLVQGEAPQQPEVLQELLRFQRACVALGWFSLLERSLRLVRRVVRRPTAEQLVQEEQERQRQAQEAMAQMPSNPFEQALSSARGLASSPRPLFSRFLPSLSPLAGIGTLPGPEDGEPELPDPVAERLDRRRATFRRREELRRQRDLERYRALRLRIDREGRDPFAIFRGEASEPGAGDAPAAGLGQEPGRDASMTSNLDGAPAEPGSLPDSAVDDPADLSLRALRRLERSSQRP